jgi:uncharacterized membrane protein
VPKKINLLLLDIASAVLLGLGVVVLLLPLALYLGLGADNDAYIEIAEWAGGKINILAHLDMVWMFRVDYLLLPAIPIIAGLLLRWSLWHWSAPPSQSQQKAEKERVSEARA